MLSCQMMRYLEERNLSVLEEESVLYDMVKVKIIYYGGGPSIPFMKIATTKAQRSGRYYLDRVRLKDFPEIIDF